MSQYAKAYINQSAGGGGGGDVTGPVSSTNNAIALWNGTGGDTLKDSGVELSLLRRNEGTGLLTGGSLSIDADPAKFDLAAGTGQVVDMSDPENPVITQVSWSFFNAQTVTNLATESSTLVCIDENGAIVQLLPNADLYTSFRSYIYVGTLIHQNNTSITSVSDVGANLAYGLSNTVTDMNTAIGPINISGNVVSANGANLQLNKSSGVAFLLGLNAKNDPTDPNRLTIGSLTAPTFLTTYRDGLGGFTNSSMSSLDVTKYDDGSGTLATVTSNRWQIFRVYVTATNMVVQYGQATYTSKALAVDGITTESFTANPELQNLLFRAYIIVRGGASALNSTSDAVFIEAGRFGSGVSGSATSAVTTLQQAYDNSPTPEIVTDSTRGALTLKRGSAADTDAVYEVQNGAGTVKFSVTGEGKANVTSTVFNGSSSGAVTVKAQATAGTWTLELPTTDGDSGQSLQTNGSGVTTWASIPFSVSSLAGNTTAVSGTTYLVNTSAARQITLPAAAANAYFFVKDVIGTCSTNNITIARAASESIEGVAANKVLQTDWGSWAFVSDGTNWFIL